MAEYISSIESLERNMMRLLDGAFSFLEAGRPAVVINSSVLLSRKKTDWLTFFKGSRISFLRRMYNSRFYIKKSISASGICDAHTNMCQLLKRADFSRCNFNIFYLKYFSFFTDTRQNPWFRTSSRVEWRPALHMVSHLRIFESDPKRTPLTQYVVASLSCNQCCS